MGHVTGPCGECVHQFEMFAMLQYVDKLVKLVIKPRIFSPVARQPALTKIVVGGLKCYHPSMKRIRSPSTELWHILAIYNLCPCDLDFWPIFSKIGSCDQDLYARSLCCSGAVVTHTERAYSYRPRSKSVPTVFDLRPNSRTQCPGLPFNGLHHVIHGLLI